MEFGPLRQHILQLAVSGQLVEQLDSEPAVEQVGPAPKPEEVPFELPPKWKWVQAGYLGDWKSGQTPSRTNQLFWSQGTIPWLKSGEITDGLISNIEEKVTELAVQDLNLRVNPPEAVVIALYGATAGKVGILLDSCVTNQACCVCIVNNEITVNWYLFYTLLAIREKLLYKRSGSAQPNLSKVKVVTTWIPIPPLEEQRRIVAKEEELLSRLDQMEAAYSEFAGPMTEHFRNLMLDKAIRGELVPQLDSEPEVEQVGPAPQPDEVPFELPSKWKWVLIKSIAKVVRGGSPRPIGQYLTDSNDPNGLNWIRIGDATGGEKLITSCKDRIKAEGLSKTRFISKGSLILSNSMSYGKPYILGVDGCIHDGWLALSDFDQFVDVDYFYYVFLSSYCQQQFDSRALGTTVSNMNSERVRSLFVPLPPIAEQRRIVAKLEEVFAGVEKLGSLMEYA